VFLKLTELRKKAERFKKARVQEEMYFDQEKQMFCDQLKAVRNALKSSQLECDMIKKELDKEVSLAFCLAFYATANVEKRCRRHSVFGFVHP